jgi:hypothetical protein
MISIRDILLFHSPMNVFTDFLKWELGLESAEEVGQRIEVEV